MLILFIHKDEVEQKPNKNLDQGVAVFAWAAIARTTHAVAVPALALVLLFAAIPDCVRT